MPARSFYASILAVAIFVSSSLAANYKLSQLSAGSVVYDPSWTWNASSLNWTVVAQNHYSASSTTLWTKSSINTGYYRQTAWDNNWDVSTERAYLNGTFYSAFSDSFKALTLTTTTDNYNMLTSSSYTSDDNVFIASATELGITVGTHFGVASPVLGTAIDYFGSDAARDIDVYYWTRTPAAGEYGGTVYPSLCEYLINDSGTATVGPWVGDNSGYAPMVNLDSDTLVHLEGDGRYSIIPEPATITIFTAAGVTLIARKRRSLNL